MEERQMATKKILEKMKQDENLRSFEGSSGPLSDDLEDSDDDDDGLSQGETGVVDQKAKSARGNRPHGGTRRVYGDMLLDGDEDDSDDDDELEVNEKAAESLKNRKS